jgi:hypothetical protein
LTTRWLEVDEKVTCAYREYTSVAVSGAVGAEMVRSVVGGDGSGRVDLRFARCWSTWPLTVAEDVGEWRHTWSEVNKRPESMAGQREPRDVDEGDKDGDVVDW